MFNFTMAKSTFHTKTMAKLLLKQGHTKKAKSILKELVKQNPDDFELLALAQQIKNKLEENKITKQIPLSDPGQSAVKLPKPSRMDLVAEEILKSQKDLRKTSILYKKIAFLRYYLKALA